jgi:uncharacterized membrane protein YccC
MGHNVWHGGSVTETHGMSERKKRTFNFPDLARALKQPMKTAIAAMLSYLAYKGLHLPHGYWAVISAVIVMQSNLGRSITTGAERLMGTAIGAVIGALAVGTIGVNAWGLLIAIAVTMALCSSTRLQTSQRLAGVTASVVMLIGEGSAWRSGLNRFMDVALGIVVALFVSVAWPSRATLDLRSSLGKTYQDLHQFWLAVISHLAEIDNKGPVDELKRQALLRSQINHDLVADFEREPGHHDPVLSLLVESSDRIRDHISGIDYSARTMSQDSLFRTLDEPFRTVYAAITGAFDLIEADLRDQPGSALPDLAGSLQKLDLEFEALRQSGAPRAFGTEELLRLYSFFYRLQQLGDELHRSMEFANALDHLK